MSDKQVPQCPASASYRAWHRQHAALMLLQHGPLCMVEFFEITGWKSYKDTQRMLGMLCDVGLVERLKRGVYGLVSAESK